MTAKKAAKSSRKAAPARRSAARATVAKPLGMWFQYHPEAGLVRLNVRDEGRPTGEDVDLRFADLSVETQNLVLDAFDAVAEEAGVTKVIEPAVQEEPV